MQVSVENTGGLERRVTVQVPAERIDQEVDSRLQSMKATARLDGFRPGKVPLGVIEKKYGTLVRQEVMQQVIHSTLQDALTQEGLRPVAEPRIDPVESLPGKPLEYVATFEVFPEITAPIDYGFRVTPSRRRDWRGRYRCHAGEIAQATGNLEGGGSCGPIR